MIPRRIAHGQKKIQASAALSCSATNAAAMEWNSWGCRTGAGYGRFDAGVRAGGEDSVGFL
ncbi:hypothetical protein D3C75_805580 [compost metagenome]